jgi:hypothetical protein
MAYRGHKMQLNITFHGFTLANLHIVIGINTQASASLGHLSVSQQENGTQCFMGYANFGWQTKEQHIP